MQTILNLIDMINKVEIYWMIKAVRGIIHDGLTEKEAMEVYNTTKSAKLE